MEQDKIIDSIIVQDFNSNKIDLLQKYNTPLLIIIYNNQCLGCTGRAIPLAYQYQKDFNNLQVIGIHSNFSDKVTSEKDIKSIFTTDELPFPIYLDEDHSVFDSFKAEGSPHWLLITSEKTLYRSIFGSQTGAQNRLLYALEDICS